MEIIKHGKTYEEPQVKVCPDCECVFTYVKKDEDDLTPRTKENIPLEELKDTWMAKMEKNLSCTSFALCIQTIGRLADGRPRTTCA